MNKYFIPVKPWAEYLDESREIVVATCPFSFVRFDAWDSSDMQHLLLPIRHPIRHAMTLFAVNIAPDMSPSHVLREMHGNLKGWAPRGQGNPLTDALVGTAKVSGEINQDDYRRSPGFLTQLFDEVLCITINSVKT